MPTGGSDGFLGEVESVYPARACSRECGGAVSRAASAIDNGSSLDESARKTPTGQVFVAHPDRKATTSESLTIKHFVCAN